MWLCSCACVCLCVCIYVAANDFKHRDIFESAWPKRLDNVFARNSSASVHSVLVAVNSFDNFVKWPRAERLWKETEKIYEMSPWHLYTVHTTWSARVRECIVYFCLNEGKINRIKCKYWMLKWSLCKCRCQTQNDTKITEIQDVMYIPLDIAHRYAAFCALLSH